MSYSVKVIADSISSSQRRLTTIQARYPKFIHGEVMTHRVFSRNASSSRAIPVARLIQDVMEDPAMPVFWGRNQKGMQAVEEMSELERNVAITGWLQARDNAVNTATRLSEMGAHKQVVNRLIEPWCHITTLITSTDWDNFFALRCHEGAQPEMRALAEAIRDARGNSKPALLNADEWHLPFVNLVESNHLPKRPDDWRDPLGISNVSDDERWWANLCLIKLSVARCARTSYLTHDGRWPNASEDFVLYERLVGSEPLHASPAEHQATPDNCDRSYGWQDPEYHGNFDGWLQFRKFLPNESV